MKIHILGICGSFMGGIAILAKQLGYEVSGCDAHVYPPMSTQLEEQGIKLTEGFSPAQFKSKPDFVIIGNAMKRGNPAVEYVLNNNIPYTSGPGWLAENILQMRHVLAVAGTHGKTTTASLLAWVLECANLNPGFMIGGVPENFSVSARLGAPPYFVIEADEYDSAFFDKRSKFVHYHPRTLILNNLEYDHADIFPNLEAIKTQFHHLVRIVPSEGKIIWPQDDLNIAAVLQQGCWTEQVLIGPSGWHAQKLDADGSCFKVYYDKQEITTVEWSLIGEHNIHNALAVFAAATAIDIDVKIITQALQTFKNVKRRMQVRGVVNNITVYDDFAHHPTAIKYNLQALRDKVGSERIIAIIDCGSYTMRTGAHQNTLLNSVQSADEVIFFKEASDWDIVGDSNVPWTSTDSVSDVLTQLNNLKPGDHIMVMSNRGFENIHQKILEKIEEHEQCKKKVG